MQNPLDQSLTNCRLLLKDGLICEHKEIRLNEIKAHSFLEHNEEFIPHTNGQSLLIALLDCDQLHDVRGHLEFIVKKPFRNMAITNLISNSTLF